MPTMPPRIPSIACALLCAVGSARAENARNPVIWADVPDISIIRAGDTYYMSSTTMHMSPGVPIMKSADLVNWDLVSYAYDTLVDNEAMRLEDGQNAYGAGSWASSLRFHNGTYYVSTFSATSGKTHVYSTTDIEKGPWEESSFGPALHDHSLFFDDDGKVYMLHGGNNLRLTELEKDTTGIKAGGFDDVVIHDASLVAGPEIGLPAEGSQMFKVNGNYYVINIAWPPGGMRTAPTRSPDPMKDESCCTTWAWHRVAWSIRRTESGMPICSRTMARSDGFPTSCRSPGRTVGLSLGSMARCRWNSIFRQELKGPPARRASWLPTSSTGSREMFRYPSRGNGTTTR